MSAFEEIDQEYREERKKTEEWRTDIKGFLSGDTSSTRRQFIRALRDRIQLISLELAAEDTGTTCGDCGGLLDGINGDPADVHLVQRATRR